MRSSRQAPSIWSGVLRAAILAVLFVAAVYFVVNAIVAVNRPSDYERLQAQPEFSLFFPGSVVVEQGGSGTGFMNPTAHTWRMLGTTASADEVLTFYRDALMERGWELGGGGVMAIDRPRETKACGWHTNETTLRLGFRDIDEYRKVYPGNAGYATVYELGLFSQPASGSLVCVPKE